MAEQKPPTGDDAFKVTEQALRVRVDIDLGSFYERLRAEALQQITDLSQQGYTGDELADRVIAALNRLSDVPIEQDARGATSEAFNLGRNLGVQRDLASVSHVIRSEILDENTCDPCRSLDGAKYEVNSDAYFHDMPPNHCNGRDLCRGFYVPIVKEAA